MSHDIRTPMNAIIGYTELLKKNGADADRRNDYIAKIEASSQYLLAEDNDLNAEIAEELLEMDGLAVERARDGIECIGMLEQRPAGYYDLILMDIQMPHMDGYKATSVIRNLADPRLAGIPIIAMTANAFDEDRKKALRTGMNAHIAKPMGWKRPSGSCCKTARKARAGGRISSARAFLPQKSLKTAGSEERKGPLHKKLRSSSS